MGLWISLSFWKISLLKLAYCLFPILALSRIILTQLSATQIRESNTISLSLISKKGFPYSRIFPVKLFLSEMHSALTYFHHGADSLIQDQYHVSKHFRIPSWLWVFLGLKHTISWVLVGLQLGQYCLPLLWVLHSLTLGHGQVV